MRAGQPKSNRLPCSARPQRAKAPQTSADGCGRPAWPASSPDIHLRRHWMRLLDGWRFIPARSWINAVIRLILCQLGRGHAPEQPRRPNLEAIGWKCGNPHAAPITPGIAGKSRAERCRRQGSTTTRGARPDPEPVAWWSDLVLLAGAVDTERVGRGCKSPSPQRTATARECAAQGSSGRAGACTARSRNPPRCRAQQVRGLFRFHPCFIHRMRRDCSHGIARSTFRKH